ncbi:MAG: nicotinate-nucleotide adenylyltransferase [Hyphomicrobiaceae bacterium]|nr:nicotinate-nucleotide adenylyltransferase [Hyphomicrobiaceae bacterium]
MRGGIMGGTFNPPHDGHLLVATTAMRRLRLDAIWWVVTPGNPLKSNGDLPPLSDRMEACRRLATHPRMHITGFEAELGASYTAITLGFLARRHPSVRFVWLMGADNLASFHRWQNWRGIARLMPIAVVDRPTWRLKASAARAARALARYRISESRAVMLLSPTKVGQNKLRRRKSASWVLMSTRLSEASSTALRRRYAGQLRQI